LINDDPSNGLKNLYLSFRNTDGSVVSRLGHIGNDGHYYIYSINPVTILSPTTINEGKAIFHDKVGVGTDNPLQNFVVSRSGNEGLEIAVDDPINKTISILGYDRSANVYRPVNFSAASFSFDKEVSVPTATQPSSAVNKSFLESYQYVETSLTTTQTKDTLNSSFGDKPETFRLYAPNVGSGMSYIKMDATSSSNWLSISGILLT